jgi:RimJ/RimL family protein N-acetyltransferase
MRAHVEALFTHDDAGRMLNVNEPSGKPAPRFFIGRTAQGSQWRFRHDVDDSLRRELELVCSSEPTTGEPLVSATYENILARVGPIRGIWSGPAYSFPDELPTAPRAVVISQTNRELLRPHLEAWLPDIETGQPLIACVIDGRAVSVCCSVRKTVIAHEAGVETATEFRGRGCAVEAVAAWARIVRDAGRIPLYSTSWQNHASQALAAKLRLLRFGADLHIT